MRSTRAIRTRKVRGTIYKANFQQGALVINNELRDFRVFLNFVVRLEILAGAKFLLFLNWLRFELNHGWAEIVASGGAKEREVARLERLYCEAHRRREAADRAERDAVGLRDADYRLVGSIEAMHFAEETPPQKSPDLTAVEKGIKEKSESARPLQSRSHSH